MFTPATTSACPANPHFTHLNLDFILLAFAVLPHPGHRWLVYLASTRRTDFPRASAL
jgi:hypothetical protein